MKITAEKVKGLLTSAFSAQAAANENFFFEVKKIRTTKYICPSDKFRIPK
jgi:hypothetical protein